MSNIKKIKYPVLSIKERETHLYYDLETRLWKLSTDVDTHIRHYRDFLDETKPITEGYGEDGRLLFIEGFIDPEKARVDIFKKRQMTPEQQEAAKKRGKYMYEKYLKPRQEARRAAQKAE